MVKKIFIMTLKTFLLLILFSSLFVGFRLDSKAHFGIADELHCADAKDSGIKTRP